MATNEAPSSQLTPPGENATPDDIKAWVEDQLDVLGEMPILGRFISLGPNERRRGGTSLYDSCFLTKLKARQTL